MKDSHTKISACLAAALLAACGGGPSTPTAPQLSQQMLRVGRSESGATKCATRVCIGSQSYRVLFSFSSGNSGSSGYAANPAGALLNVKGTLYGTTEAGGEFSDGTIYYFFIHGEGKYRLLHSFGASSDGAIPAARLINVKGTLYGTTEAGGEFGNGTMYYFFNHGNGQYHLLHSFGASGDGAIPAAPLINVKGRLYGTTEAGGEFGNGTIYYFFNHGNGQYHLLHSFGGSGDGAVPAAPLINVNGTLYGTTFGGGAYSHGTVFSITTGGKETVLHSFTCQTGQGCTDGSGPRGGLINVNGTLYGTTTAGGCGGSPSCTANYGTVFSITTGGAESVVYSFHGAPNYNPYDGTGPATSLIELNGTLYGVTPSGGQSGQGTIFSLPPSGGETVLHSFGSGNDGLDPSSSLINVGGTLYGTTFGGGGGNCPPGCGTVFALKP